MKINHLYFLFALLLCSGTTLRAQESAPAPEKEIVVIVLFARNQTVPPAYAEALRQQVMAAFADRGRHRIVDARQRPNWLRRR